MTAANLHRARPIAGAFRHLLSILALPFMNTVVIPSVLLLLAGGSVLQNALQVRSFAVAPGIAMGFIFLAAGGALVVASIRLFASRGEGTLAPWDPPRKLVVTGPYRYVRNPMKSGLILLLIAETLILRSAALGVWCLVFGTVNAAYIRISEEPGLRRRFGAAYEEYCAAVPAWFPRFSPWAPPATASSDRQLETRKTFGGASL